MKTIISQASANVGRAQVLSKLSLINPLSCSLSSMPWEGLKGFRFKV